MANQGDKLTKRVTKYLEDNHSKIFCKRDWAYIDLILFYLNTGRADSLKEALQLIKNKMFIKGTKVKN